VQAAGNSDAFLPLGFNAFDDQMDKVNQVDFWGYQVDQVNIADVQIA